MKHLRRLSQVLFLLLFLFLLSRATYPMDASLHEGVLTIFSPLAERLGGLGEAIVKVLSAVVWKPLWRLPPETFMRLDPLAATVTMLATRSVLGLLGLLWPAAIVFGLAFLLGRAFCGWVCPLGTTFDAFDRVLISRHRPRAVHTPRLARVKYLVLGLLLLWALFGVQLAGWVDPLSIATRSYGLVVHPAADFAYRHALLPLIQRSEHLSDTLSPVQELIDAHAKRREDASLSPVFRQQRLFAGILLGLLLVLFYQKRFWCRNLCPLGALLGLCAKTCAVKVSIDGRCTDCKKCEQACPVGAIKDRRVSPEECTLCWLCVGACPSGAISIGVGRRAAGAERLPVLPGRRLLLQTGALGLLALPVLGLNAVGRRGESRLIRPPGARPEEDLLRRCIRCGECMKVCPGKAIQPTGLEEGLEGLWTPRLVPRLGFCIYECNDLDRTINNLCGLVCPTGAIQRLRLEEKVTWKMGTSYIDRSKCIPWVWNKNCGKCEEHCPVPGKAIHFYEPGGLGQGRGRAAGHRRDPTETEQGLTEDLIIRRPYVIAERCIGCGQCEYVCPVEGAAAVRVDRLQVAPADS